MYICIYMVPGPDPGAWAVYEAPSVAAPRFSAYNIYVPHSSVTLQLLQRDFLCTCTYAYSMYIYMHIYSMSNEPDESMCLSVHLSICLSGFLSFSLSVSPSMHTWMSRSACTPTVNPNPTPNLDVEGACVRRQNADLGVRLDLL